MTLRSLLPPGLWALALLSGVLLSGGGCGPSAAPTPPPDKAVTSKAVRIKAVRDDPRFPEAMKRERIAAIEREPD